MKHYYHPMSRAITTDWMLKELDAPHEQIVIDYTKGENSSEEFCAINPMQKLPTLVDDDAVVTEAAAICLYLADKYIDKGLAPAIGSKQRGLYYRAILFSGNSLEPMFTVDANEAAQFDAQSVGWGNRSRVLATVETLTPETGWLLGEQFSAADLVFGGTLDFSMQFGWLKEPSPRVKSYVERMRARPIYRQTHPEAWYA